MQARRFWIWSAAALAVGGAAAAPSLLTPRAAPPPTGPVGLVERADLHVRVMVRGQIQAQQATQIKCQVLNFGRPYGAQILRIVPDGHRARQGELLALLDSPIARERYERYSDLLPRYVALQIQAAARLENQKTQNETYLAKARLALETARLQLASYADRRGGSYQLQWRSACLNAQQALAALRLAANRRAATEALYQIGYRSRNQVQQASLETLKAEGALARAVVALGKLQQYDQPMQRLRLETAVIKAEQNLRRIEVGNRSRLIERQADKFEADQRLARYRKIVARYRQQLENFKVYAPHDGVVVYERDAYGRTTVAEGAPVRWGQTLMRLVETSRVQADLPIHELDVGRIRPGQPVRVRLIALPDRLYHGRIRALDPLPHSPYWKPGINYYHAVVPIEEQVEDVRPGMTCVGEIQVATIRNAATAPAAAILETPQGACVYVVAGRSVERRLVRTGVVAGDRVEILSGLKPGERVALDPGRHPARWTAASLASLAY